MTNSVDGSSHAFRERCRAKEEQVREPLLSNAGPAKYAEFAMHKLHGFRRTMKAWTVGLMEDDQEFLTSVWSRRPYLGYALPAFFSIAAFADVSYDDSSLAFTSMDVLAVVMNALVFPYVDKASKWVDLFVCAQCMAFTAVWSYSLRGQYYSTAAQASYSLFMIFLGLRTRYLALTVTLVYVLFDRSTGGVLILVIALISFFVCCSLVQAFFYTAFSLQRSQDVLVQYVSDGFCSVSVDQGYFVFACSRFQDVFKSHNLCGRRLQDFIDAADQSRVDEMLESAKHGRFKQCLVTCYVRDAAIAFDAALIPHQHNCHNDSVHVCLKLQGEVRQVDKKSNHGSGVETLPPSGRNQSTFVDIGGSSYHEIQVNSSAQQSDDSIYAVMWDIIDAAASNDIVGSFGARTVVMEAQQMQTLIFAQETRVLQRAVARSLLARYDRIRLDVLRANVATGGLRPLVWQDRHSMEAVGNLDEGILSSRERILEDIVSCYRVFHLTKLFSCNPCLRGLSITCEMLGFFGPLPHHRRVHRPAMMHLVRNFERD